ncbi:MAG: helix-turn-helix transcriptional regulator [Pseudonocardiaceae bacterium]
MVVKRRSFAQARRAAGYSQESLAERLGVDRTTVARWEAGEYEPQPWQRPRIAEAFGLSHGACNQLLDESGMTERAVGVAASVTEADGALLAGYRELLRLLSMAGVLMTTPNADEQLDQSDYPSIASGRFDNVAGDDYAALNEHLWRVFMPSKSKVAVLPLVCDQFDVLIFDLNRSRGISTHRQLCALVLQP